MRALQALVIFLGILIVAGLTLVVALMIQRPESKSVTGSPSIARLDVPRDFRVAEMAATGGRVVLRLDAKDGRQRLLVFDPVSGATSRILDIGTQP
jgi:hypothetical protein